MFSKEKEDKAKGGAPGSGDVIGFIGKGMFVEGTLTFENTIRIDGNLKGKVNSKGTLVVGDTGMIEGEIRVDTAIITGEVIGMAEAKTRVELRSPAKFRGEIRTPNLIIGDGAVFDGKCVMLKKDAAQAPETAHFEHKDDERREPAPGAPTNF